MQFLHKNYFLFFVGSCIFAMIILIIAFLTYSPHLETATSTQSTANEIIQKSEPLISHSTTVQLLKGTAKLKTVSSETPLQIGQTTAIDERDEITTGVESIAIIDYGEGTLARLGPETTLSFDIAGNTLSIHQAIGNVYYRFKTILGIREGMNVETPMALAVVRGTTFAVFHHTTTKVVTTVHTVKVYQKDEKSLPLPDSNIDVKEGTQVEVASFSAQSILTPKEIDLPANEDSWMLLNSELDNLIDSETSSPELISDVLQRYFTGNVPPTNAPSPTPISPSKTPTPTVTSVPKVSEMFGTGYNSGLVQTDVGTFSLSCIGSSKNAVKVVTDSANESDCKNDCPVKSLQEYVQANNGFAGMNGMYFCPADYPACSEKKNSFDTLFFNSRVKQYINSDNNVFSVIPFLAVQSDGTPRFIEKSQDWGRDTGIAAGIAGNPLLVHNGQYVAENTSLDDKQRNAKTNRGAFVQKGDNLYLCVVKSANVPNTGRVYQALHVDNAINIDGGGSTALWVNGKYTFGPGRAIPNAIIFANK